MEQFGNTFYGLSRVLLCNIPDFLLCLCTLFDFHQALSNYVYELQEPSNCKLQIKHNIHLLRKWCSEEKVHVCLG